VAAEPAAECVEDGPVHLVQPEDVDTEQIEPPRGELVGDEPLGPDLYVVANSPEQAVRDPGSPP
jgi:hypothetical protein